MKADNEEVQKFLNAILKELIAVRMEQAKMRERIDAFSPEKKSWIAKVLRKEKK